MNTLFIILWLFFGLSLLSSLLVVSACVLSSRASRDLEGFEPAPDTVFEGDSQYERGLVKETISA